MRILIVEDETRIAKRIERMTREICADKLTSLFHISTLDEASEFIENNPLDLVLLDLNLNGQNGFDLLHVAVSGAFHTIIISAYKDQAIMAFEHGVLDFVPKPFNQQRLEKAFERFHSKTASTAQKVKYLAVKSRQQIHLIALDKVLYIKGAGPYSEMYLKDGKRLLHDKSLEKLEQLLKPDFLRIHKSYLVRLNLIQQITVNSGSKYAVKLKTGEVLPVGRTRYKALKDQLI